jgi:hypothetical protein
MNNKLKIIAVLLVLSVAMFACSGGKSKRNPNALPPLQITIADEVKDDAELTQLIKSSENAINEFSDNMEQLVIDGKDILMKPEDEQTVMDGLKTAKLMVQFISNSTQLAVTIEKFDTYVNGKKEQGIINDAQLKALEQVSLAFGTRMEQLNEKYKNYYNQ